MRMTVRPRLWRISDVILYVGYMAPSAVRAWSIVVTAFVIPFLRMQKRENWNRR